VAFGQAYRPVEIDGEITSVQPMTGIVLRHDNPLNDTDAISLEYAYVKYNDIVEEAGVYNWTVLEIKPSGGGRTVMILLSDCHRRNIPA
jgi:hypothetical protein